MRHGSKSSLEYTFQNRGKLSTSYYHVTFAANIESIRAQGIHPVFWPSWEHRGTGERYGRSDEIHAFTHYVDAVRWASHMEWEFFRKMGSGSIVIVEFTPEGKWREHKTSDPLPRATMKGIWKTSRTPVWPERIRMIEVLTTDIVNGAVIGKGNKLQREEEYLSL